MKPFYKSDFFFQTTPCIALIMWLASLSAFAQNNKPDIITDRPDQTEAPFLLPEGSLQVETGFMLEKDQTANVEFTNYTYNTTLIKYGINENLELRLICEYLNLKSRDRFESNVSTLKGISPLAVGIKLRIADEIGLWPQAAMIGHINVKTGSEAFKPAYTAADFRFTFAHSLTDELELSYNIGAEWDGESPEASFIYTVSLAYAMTDHVEIFAESYGFLPESHKCDHRFDTGLMYKFTNVIQADISAGIGLNEIAPDYFLSAGISFRLFK